MATLSPVIRGGPLLGMLALLAMGTPATASDAQHHYSVYGSLTPMAATPSGGGSLQLNSRLSSARSMIPAQSGGNLVMTAKLALAPLGCAGDTIFANGFDP